MYNDTIKVANKIISETDLADIFQRMNDEIKENEQICRQEKMQNEKYEWDYQHWTTKDFEGEFKCEFNFYDDTNITVDNYNSFITLFNNRLHEVKDMWIRYSYSSFFCIIDIICFAFSMIVINDNITIHDKCTIVINTTANS